MPEPHQHPRAPLDVLVVSHTHWDREWYRTAGEFRQLLVALIDELLDDPATTPFLLDGQSILLDDYLSIRPERAAELRDAFRRGRVEAGPWYVLADELIPSGEALVRNLLAGRRRLRAIGATAPPVLYSPDAFGHPASLPELAHGFGLALAIVWRGYGGARWPSGDVARWSSPSGREVVLMHLPPDGYEFGASLPVGADDAHRRWSAIREVLSSRSRLGLALLPNGADHHARQRHLSAALETFTRVALPDRLRAAGMFELVESVSARAATTRLPGVRGELRDSYGYTWTLGGTLASRAAQKRRNAALERLLLRDTEPWVALAVREGGPDAAPLLDACWQTLLACHPHDSLCGCSIDEVAAAVDARFAAAERDASFLRDRVISSLLGHEPDRAREHNAPWRPALIVRNPVARVRSGVAEIEIDIPIRAVAVGPGSAASYPLAGKPAPLGTYAGIARLQRLTRGRVHVREESPRAYPRDVLVERHQVLAWIDAAPAYGLGVHARARRKGESAAASSGAWASADGIASDAIMIKVSAGGIDLHAGGRVVRDVIGFQTHADAGDLYTPAPIPDSQRSGTLIRWRITARGPLRSELTTWWKVPVAPRELTTATGSHVRHAGGAARVMVRFQLDAGASHVRLVVGGDWDQDDARLRLRVRTDLPGASCWADAMFGDVQRRPLVVPPVEKAAEQVQHVAPLHRFVSRYTSEAGATLVSDGLAEYEAFDDGSIAVTLVRAVGDLSRSTLAERPGHAGWPVSTPAAQTRGPFGARFAVALHGPRSPEQVCATQNLAEDVLLPLTGTTWHAAIDPRGLREGIALDGRGLVFTTMKPSEDRAWTVVRCVNVLDEWTDGAWHLPGSTEAFLARLDELPLGALVVADSRVPFHAPPRGIVTVLVR